MWTRFLWHRWCTTILWVTTNMLNYNTALQTDTSGKQNKIEWNFQHILEQQCVCSLCQQEGPFSQLPFHCTPFNGHVWASVLYSIYHSSSRSSRGFFPFCSFLNDSNRNRRRSSCHRVWPSQALCLSLVVDMVSLSSSLCLRCYKLDWTKKY